MRKVTRGKLLIACSICFLIGWLSGTRVPANLLAELPPKKANAPVFPMPARLGGNIYLQASAEYRACCYAIYRCAAFRLEATLKATRPRPTNPAVIMDLDETVFDNSAFQTFLYKNNLEYTDQLWADYEENYPQDVTLIPGAKQFIKKAESLGVTVVFISNRSEVYKKSTVSALGRLGVVNTKLEDRLYLKPKGGSSDKSARREAAAVRYNVLMYFGDNLRDFSEAFTAKKLPKGATPVNVLQAIKERGSLADEARSHWGVDWFVLPNPVYGEWEKLIGPDPIAILHPTTMKVRGREPK